MIRLLFFALTLFSINTYAGNIIDAKVIKVYDGDTITFIVESDINELNKQKGISPTQFKGRLYGIDAPELNQDFGKRSRNYLADLILGKSVKLEGVATDKYGSNFDIYGRLVVKIYLNDDYINLKLVEQGYAWSYTKYNNNDYVLNEAEKQARSNGLGLWNTGNPPINPADWRKLKKNGTNVTELGPTCDYKLTCKSMRTCDEAMHLLKECEFFYLDSNNDGVPCENLCK